MEKKNMKTNSSFDINSFCKFDYPIVMDRNSVKDIGILNLNYESIKFVSDSMFIYANEKPIISTCNCRESSVNAFTELMKVCFVNNFIKL